MSVCTLLSIFLMTTTTEQAFFFLESDRQWSLVECLLCLPLSWAGLAALLLLLLSPVPPLACGYGHGDGEKGGAPVGTP